MKVSLLSACSWAFLSVLTSILSNLSISPDIDAVGATFCSLASVPLLLTCSVVALGSFFILSCNIFLASLIVYNSNLYHHFSIDFFILLLIFFVH